MEGNIKAISGQRAWRQWQQLSGLIQTRAIVELLPPQLNLPDMIFTANAGLILEDKFVLSSFLHAERQDEESHFAEWFAANDYGIYRLPRDIPFEGAGDALLDREQSCLWAGFGHRSALESHDYLERWLNIEVISLRLVDDRFYHLDTCFCPLENGYLLYYPLAFDAPSRRMIEKRIPELKRIPVSEADALGFACNAVNIDDLVILNSATPELRERLSDADFEVVQAEMSEFLKAGGAAKCLTLRLNEKLLEVGKPAPALYNFSLEEPRPTIF
jgi:N-dimethylarginine dimethylaminohydrolase